MGWLAPLQGSLVGLDTAPLIYYIAEVVHELRERYTSQLGELRQVFRTLCIKLFDLIRQLQ